MLILIGCHDIRCLIHAKNRQITRHSDQIAIQAICRQLLHERCVGDFLHLGSRIKDHGTLRTLAIKKIAVLRLGHGNFHVRFQCVLYALGVIILVEISHDPRDQGNNDDNGDLYF